jgi:hypothetical protein
MNVFFLSTVGTLLADTPSGTRVPELETGTVALGLLIVAVVWLAKAHVKLRAELEDLRNSLRPKTCPVAPIPASGPTPAEIIAIAVAVQTVLGVRARLVAVGTSGANGHLEWSLEGRRQVFQSHQLR